MKTIKQEYHIITPLSKVWQALVDPKIIDKWGGGPTKMSAKEGLEFSLWGGEVFGKNLKVVKNKTLVQNWSYKGWSKPSRVTFTLTHKNGCTTIYLLHEHVPENEFEDISEGWEKYYLGEIKKLLEQF